jgi:hypothetical protein
MTTMVYGKRGEPLRIEPIEPIHPQAHIRPEQKPVWIPTFEARHASNEDLRRAAAIIAHEMSDRVHAGKATVDEFNSLVRNIETWRDNW